MILLETTGFGRIEIGILGPVKNAYEITETIFGASRVPIPLLFLD